MREIEKSVLIYLLGLRRDELIKELQINESSNIPIIEWSKKIQIEYINELILQLL